MRKRNDVVAIACADIHLSHTTPICRSGELDWYEAMERTLGQLRGLQESTQAPILCAGDVFDKWDSRPELINWAIKHLPPMYAIPGQHDLPQHRLDDVRKSAYWTLVEAGVIDNLPADSPIYLKEGLVVHPFPWGVPIEYRDLGLHGIDVAVAHQYAWIKGHSFPGAPEEGYVPTNKVLNEFHVVIFGDNHKGFLYHSPADTAVFNCGTLMRRKADEAGYVPQVGLIHSDGRITPHDLDTSADILDASHLEVPEKTRLDVQEFMEGLEGLGQDGLDFREAVERYIRSNKVEKDVKDVLIEALGERTK